MSELKAAIVHDDNLRAQANAAGCNYWPVYYREILNRMGLPHSVLGPDELTADDLEQYSILLLPPLPQEYLTDAQAKSLSAWVTSGGLLLGFATGGLDELFGISVEGAIEQAGDEFTPSACIRLCDEEFNAALLPPYERGAAMPVLAQMQRLRAPDCRELARLLSLFEQDLQMR